jgi:hypothetical protein
MYLDIFGLDTWLACAATVLVMAMSFFLFFNAVEGNQSHVSGT